MNIQHPDGNGRQQPDRAAYTIVAAKPANPSGDTIELVTAEAGALHVSAADAPALWGKAQAWAALPGNAIAPYAAPPACAADPVFSTLAQISAKLDRFAAVETALIGKGALTKSEIDAATMPKGVGMSPGESC